LAKLNDGVLDLWAELLRKVPNSRLLLARDALCGTVKARLHEAFVTRGVEASRLDFRHELPGGLHLPLYQQIDVALDTFPWSGHTTACEALWMGVPVVTLATDRHAGRMVASVLHAVGRDEWTATNRREYIDIAARLASDRTKLADIRRGLRPAMLQSPLCDTVGFARQLETVLRGVWKGKVSK
jgi:predicted O-linked N-acetylglucosamine transferase (SPINDLY family)